MYYYLLQTQRKTIFARLVYTHALIIVIGQAIYMMVYCLYTLQSSKPN